MRRFLTLAFVSTILLSCGNNDSFVIDGYAESADDGDTITLAYSSDGKQIAITDRAVVKNHRFRFEGKTEKDRIFYIGHKKNGQQLYTLFFLEKGNISANIGKERCRIGGTPLNDLYNSATDSIRHYTKELDSIRYRIKCDSRPFGCNMEEHCLSGFNVQNRMTEYIRSAINGNIDNVFGLYMLVVYNSLFDADEFSRIAGNIPEENTDRENNCLYDIIMEIKNDRQSPENIEDIMNAANDVYYSH